jgi:IrrE N-terminal-like domain
MMLPLWVAELADHFWRAAGLIESFPRSLRRPILRALPVTVIALPALRLEAVRTWLRRHDKSVPESVSDRPLHACLMACSGYGLIFLDSDDADDEQRFSLAHETAHFLRHYLQPRQRIERNLGKRALEVLDGRRPPSEAERLHALLAAVPIGPHFHTLERDGGGRIVSGTIASHEEEADRLAYELLAPADEIARRIQGTDRAELVELLRQTFGLPEVHARGYAELLLPTPFVDPLLRRLGIA